MLTRSRLAPPLEDFEFFFVVADTIPQAHSEVRHATATSSIQGIQLQSARRRLPAAADTRVAAGMWPDRV